MDEYELLFTAIEQGEVVQTVTLIEAAGEDTEMVGQMMLLFPDGRAEGRLAQTALGKKVLEEINYAKWTKPCTVTGGDLGLTYRAFWDSVGSDQFRVCILGAGHISQPLAKLFSLLDYIVTVVDDRPDFANKERFPAADNVICGNFKNVLQNFDFDNKTAVIIITRGHRHDLDCLRSVLVKTPGYAGMIGSRVKVQGALNVLVEEGYDRQLLAKLRAPIGLDIGAQTPAEIAVSIVSEVVEVFRGGSFVPLSRCKEGGHG